MKNILLTLQYDGTNYSGWQIQKNAITIQQKIQESIQKVFKESINVNGCSRTDAGVHALDYKCNFFTKSYIPVNKIPVALNCNLPDDICVIDAKEVEQDFHARYSANYKTYCYKIMNSKYINIFKRNYSYFYPYSLNISLMKRSLEYFIGKHDFRAFMSSGSSINDTIRTITDLQIKSKDDLLVVYVKADGFLYNMVRIITGTLIEVGNERIDSGQVPQIIENKDRTLAGFTAPPQGLYLYKVDY